MSKIIKIYPRDIDLDGQIMPGSISVQENEEYELDLSGCEHLTTLPALPAGLKKLNLLGCGLTKLPEQLPAGLTELDLSSYRLTKLPEQLPAGLTKLDLSNCWNLTTLPELPAGLTELNLSGCKHLTTLPALPAGLKKLNLLGCEALTTLPELPAGLTELDLSSCRLTKLPEQLPAGLTKLDLSDCCNLTTLPELPAGLTMLNFLGCMALTTLPKLPDGLTELDLSHCISLTTLPKLPAGLTELDLSGCAALTTLPELPAGLKKLNLVGCEALTKLPEQLPAGLTELDLSDCWNLTTLPKLPTGLTELNLSRCEHLTTLPELPAGLIGLDLSGCSSLPNTPALVARLEALELRNAHNPNFRLIWPEHIDRSGSQAGEVMEALKSSYKKYYENNVDFAGQEPQVNDKARYPVLTLFHRFFSESVAMRGGINKIVGSTFPTIKYIAENPEILEFIGENAKASLDACVNQPVAGFTEIACLVNIAKQPDIKSKLEAAKIIMAVDLIRKEIGGIKNQGGNKVGGALEVELANAMLMSVNIKLLQNNQIKEPLPGVPDGIAYQHTINSFLTEANIKLISEKVSQILKTDLSQVANHLCEGPLQDFWANMVLSKDELRTIKAPLEAAKAEFSKDGSDSNSDKVKNTATQCRKSILTSSREKTDEHIKTLSGVGTNPALASASSLSTVKRNRMGS